MFQQQSPDSQHPTHLVYPQIYDRLRNKNHLSEFYNYDLNPCNGQRNPSSYLTQSSNQDFSDLKTNPNFINNCNILHPMWPNHLDSIPRPQMSYHPMSYPQCNYSHVTNPTGSQYQMPLENSVWLEQMKNMPIDPVQIQNYQKLNIEDYNVMFGAQYSKNDLNPSNREKECVRCGVITGNAWQKDNNGHFLCMECFRSNSYVSSTLDMIPPYKRNQLNKNLARKQTAKRTGLLCSNCKTENTTLWRRNSDGQPVCNACGLYYRLHKTHRPPSMRKETLQTRKRKTKKKQNMCMKFMEQEYPIKSELANSMDQQILSSPFSNAPVHISAHCLPTDKFDSSFRHHGFDLSQPPSNLRSSNVNELVHPASALPHHNGFEFLTQQ